MGRQRHGDAAQAITITYMKKKLMFEEETKTLRIAEKDFFFLLKLSWGEVGVGSPPRVRVPDLTYDMIKKNSYQGSW